VKMKTRQIQLLQIFIFSLIFFLVRVILNYIFIFIVLVTIIKCIHFGRVIMALPTMLVKIPTNIVSSIINR